MNILNHWIRSFFSALYELWHTRENLAISRIRSTELLLMLALPLAVVIADMQYSVFKLPLKLFGLDSATVLYASYSVGALSMLALREKHILLFIRISMLVTVITLPIYFIFSDPQLRFAAASLGFLGLGGCAISATLIYCAALNNTERWYGALLLAFCSPLFAILKSMNDENIIANIVLPVSAIAAMLFCLSRIKPGHLPKQQEQEKTHQTHSLTCALIYAVCYFTITIFQSQLFLVNHLEGKIPYLAGSLAAALLAVLIQLLFKCSIWHMWNLYFILTTIGILGLMLQTKAMMLPALVITGVAVGIGYITVFYMGAGIIKRHFSMAFFKKALFIFMGMTLIAILLSGAVSYLLPDKLFFITAALSGLSFIVITLLSPVLHENLFASHWIDDFIKLDMSPANDIFHGYGFTEREKEICRLLLDGYTLRQIAAITGLAYSTVNTYYTAVYRKLNINSRAELILHFKSHLDKQS